MNNPSIREKLENFSRLSDEECALIIRDYLLEALESDIYFDWEVVSKFMSIPYEIRDRLCSLFNSSIKRNNQRIGTCTVSEWIKKYQDQYINKERNPNTFFEYVSNSPEIKKLSKTNQIKLARIFRMYDYLFIVPVFDLEGPVFNILRFPMELASAQDGTASQNIFTKEQTIPQKKIIISSLFFHEALKRYPEFGEQIITPYHIKIQSFSQPVRPSIKNWISDYTSYYGYTNHNQMTRGDYLFKNENAKILPVRDKEKLSYILKAFDENETIKTDSDSKQVIFPEKPQPVSPDRAKIAIEPKQEIRQPEQKRSQTFPSPYYTSVPTPAYQKKEKAEPRSDIQYTSSVAKPVPSVNFQPSVPAAKPDYNRQKNSLSFTDDNYFASFSPSYRNRPVSSADRQPTTINQPLPTHNQQRETQPQKINTLPSANLNFSSPQKLPYEKEKETEQETRIIPPPVSPKPIGPQPLHISPTNRFREERKEERPLPKNVVNLKE